VTTPDISIVITNFNYARFVGHAIASALDQGKPTEVIVVDDGSTDDSAAVIAGFGSRVSAIFTGNGGQAAAFNAGWRTAHGKVVMFLDADDVLAPDIATRVAARFEMMPGLGRVQFPLTLIDDGGQPLEGTVPPAGKRLFRGDPATALARCPDDIVWQPTSGNAFARHVLEQILPMPEPPYRICADFYLSNLSAVHGPVDALDDPGGMYRVHGGNSHFAMVETLDRLRDNVRRTDITHRLLIEECDRAGIVAPARQAEEVRSVTATANRLISLRMDADAHPLRMDTLASLVRLGVRSAVARCDLHALRRLAYAGWFVVAAVVPRRWLPVVARPYVAIRPAASQR
jgi:glycosyltransferase involved in cell wall biosynthesis